ncbi:diguanylate cyclase [bacterium]|nr:diguanylate cyclase [bacterium]
METRKINKILNEFVKSSEWKQVRLAILFKIDSPGWVVNKDREFIYKVEQDRKCCEIIKSTPSGKILCHEFFKELFSHVYEKKNSVVLACRAGLYGVACPLLVEDNLIGVVGGCQILTEEKDLTKFENFAKKIKVDPIYFLNSIKQGYTIATKNLELEMNLIALLSQAAINVVLKEDYALKANANIKKILELYKSIEERREFILENKLENLYTLILDDMLSILKYKSSYLIMIDKRTKKLVDKFSNSVVELKINEDLIKKIVTDFGVKFLNIPKPMLFLNINLNSPYHYLLALSHKEDETEIGEEDIEIANLVRDFLSIAIRGLVCSFEKKEKKEKELMIKGKKEMIGDQVKSFQDHVKKAEEFKKQTENIKNLVEKMSNDKVNLNEIKEEKEKLKSQVEELNTVIVELEEQATRLKKEAEELEREQKYLKEEGSKKAKELKQRLEELKKQEEELRKNTETLKKQAEEAKNFIAQMEEVQELKEKTNELNILYSVSSDLSSLENPVSILQHALDKIKPYFNYQISSYLYLQDEDSLVGKIDNLSYASEENLEEIKKRMADRWKIIEGKEVKRKIEFTVERPALVSMAGEYHEIMNSHLITPLTEKGSLIGLLFIGNLEKDFFDTSKIRLFSIIGSHISVALEKARFLAKTKEMAEHDTLTGIYNLRYFEQFLAKEISYGREVNGQLSVIMMDLDNLKRVNDTYGHEWGNKYLQIATFLLQGTISKGNCLARIGGDEFVVALPGATKEEAAKTARKIKDMIANYEFSFAGKIHKMSASLGVASFSKNLIFDNKDMMFRADKALYQAKSRGKNQVCLYKEEEL